MAKQRIVVNGYPVPTGFSGVAVRRACELVVASPGIRQADLLDAAVRFSGLNYSTAGWITSPGPKSPATILWDRRKEDVFRCYPNEHTEKVVGAQGALNEEKRLLAVRLYKSWKYRPKLGDLVKSETHRVEGVFLGYSYFDGIRDGEVRSTFEEAINVRENLRLGDHFCFVLMENGTNQIKAFNIGYQLQPANM